MEHFYRITGMHCESCVSKVAEALKKVPDVTGALVSLSPPQVKVQMTHHVSTKTLDDAVKSAGSYSLEKQENGSSMPAAHVDDTQSLRPLFVIVAYVIGGVVLRAFLSGNYNAHALMSTFMGGFFVVFSLFKMIDLSGFADGYSTYDVIAKRSRAYALTYPFIELALGIAYLASWQLTITNFITLILMTVGAVGVFQALREKRAIQCACLGTALKLPMTKVTLVEDVGMAGMALLMLLF